MISKEEVKHIAKLARLELTDQEIQKMQKDLSGILDYIDVLKKVPQAKTGVTSSIKNLQQNSLRQDKVVDRSLSQANNLIAQSPDAKDGYLKVKNIF